MIRGAECEGGRLEAQFPESCESWMGIRAVLGRSSDHTMISLVLPCDPDVPVVPVFYPFIAYGSVNVKHQGLLTCSLLPSISPFNPLSSYHLGVCMCVVVVVADAKMIHWK